MNPAGGRLTRPVPLRAVSSPPVQSHSEFACLKCSRPHTNGNRFRPNAHCRPVSRPIHRLDMLNLSAKPAERKRTGHHCQPKGCHNRDQATLSSSHNDAARAGVVPLNCVHLCARQRQRTGAVQNANASSHAPENAKRLGLRLSSGAFTALPRVSMLKLDWITSRCWDCVTDSFARERSGTRNQRRPGW